MNKELENKGRALSKLLRHQPDDLEMDKNGWVSVNELLEKVDITQEELEFIVTTNDKQRFVISEDTTKIRANQGHSIDVDVELKVTDPPEFLYHGTSGKNLPNIRNEGIKKMNRLHVHLSEDMITAFNVAKRKGSPVVIEINTFHMRADKIKLYLSKNNIWLADYIDPKYIKTVTSGKIIAGEI